MNDSYIAVIEMVCEASLLWIMYLLLLEQRSYHCPRHHAQHIERHAIVYTIIILNCFCLSQYSKRSNIKIQYLVFFDIANAFSG